jgi:hypothetical protein
MFLPNPMVYIQYHPVTYMVKLNIEMKMASLIRKLAKDSNISEMHEATMHLTGDFPPPDPCPKTYDMERAAKHARHVRHIHFAEVENEGFEPEDLKILKTTSVRVVTSPRPFVYDRPSHMI